jgi:hypothetical protein
METVAGCRSPRREYVSPLSNVFLDPPNGVVLRITPVLAGSNAMSLRPTKRPADPVDDADEDYRDLPKTIHSPIRRQQAHLSTSPRAKKPPARIRQQSSRIEANQCLHSMKTWFRNSDRRLKTVALSTLSLLGYMVLAATKHCMMLLASSLRSSTSKAMRPMPNPGFVDELNILLQTSTARKHLHLPHEMNIYDKVNGDKPEHGGLNMRLLADTSRRHERRSIYIDFAQDRGYEDLKPDSDDWREGYYAFDDDVERNPLAMWEDDTIQDKRRCRRTSWHRELHPNCNVVHEYDALRLIRDGHSKFAG